MLPSTPPRWSPPTTSDRRTNLPERRHTAEPFPCSFFFLPFCSCPSPRSFRQLPGREARVFLLLCACVSRGHVLACLCVCVRFEGGGGRNSSRLSLFPKEGGEGKQRRSPFTVTIYHHHCHHHHCSLCSPCPPKNPKCYFFFFFTFFALGRRLFGFAFWGAQIFVSPVMRKEIGQILDGAWPGFLFLHRCPPVSSGR